MQRRHRILLDSAAKAVTHDKVSALAQFFHETRSMPKVIAVVGISHHDVLASRCGNAPHQRVAVSFRGHPHHPGPHPLRDLDRTIAAAVVCDNDLTCDVRFAQSALRFPDAGSQRLCLIQAGHDHS